MPRYALCVPYAYMATYHHYVIVVFLKPRCNIRGMAGVLPMNDIMHYQYATTANTVNNMQSTLAVLCNSNLYRNSDRIPLATYTEM